MAYARHNSLLFNFCPKLVLNRSTARNRGDIRFRKGSGRGRIFRGITGCTSDAIGISCP